MAETDAFKKSSTNTPAADGPVREDRFTSGSKTSDSGKVSQNPIRPQPRKTDAYQSANTNTSVSETFDVAKKVSDAAKTAYKTADDFNRELDSSFSESHEANFADVASKNAGSLFDRTVQDAESVAKRGARAGMRGGKKMYQSARRALEKRRAAKAGSRSDMQSDISSDSGADEFNTVKEESEFSTVGEDSKSEGRESSATRAEADGKGSRSSKKTSSPTQAKNEFQSTQAQKTQNQISEQASKQASRTSEFSSVKESSQRASREFLDAKQASALRNKNMQRDSSTREVRSGDKRGARKSTSGSGQSSGSQRYQARSSLSSGSSQQKNYAKQKTMQVAKDKQKQQATVQLAKIAKAVVQAIVQLITSAATAIGSAFISFAGPLLIAVAIIIFGVSSCSVTFMTTATEESYSYESLTENESIVASTLLGLGYNEVQVAAIMGNIAQESSFDPTSDNGSHWGIVQWSSTRWSKFLRWIEKNGGDSDEDAYDLKTQTLFIDYELQSNKSYYRYTTFMSYEDEDDLYDATELIFTYYEAPQDSTLTKRYNFAKKYYAILTGGAQSTANITDAQQAIIDATKEVSSPGRGFCARWVSQVFEYAGYGYPGGDARDMYNSWCTSSNLYDLKVGMIVAVSTHTHTSAGKTYGHVAIYIGDGEVRDNVGYIRTKDLYEWISYYSTTVTVKWGWINGTDLSEED